MPIITLIIVLILIGAALYCINQLLPIDPKIKLIINVVVILCVLLWLLDIFVGFGHLGNVRITH